MWDHSSAAAVSDRWTHWAILEAIRLMSEDAASHMKSRLRSDLVAAMRSRRTSDVALIRELVAAIDNAEAPSSHAEVTVPIRHAFGSGSAEVERLVLSGAQIRALLLTEIQKRERAASEFERLGELERAAALRAEVLVAKRYVE
jgi:uncharacterized protein